MKYNFTKQQIIEAFNQAGTSTGAAKLLGIKWSTYKTYAIKYDCYQKNQGAKGISKPKKFNRDVDFNDRFFDQLDTVEQAYILGFMAADSAPRASSIVFNLSAKDEEILEYICNCLGKDNNAIIHYLSYYKQNGIKKYFDSIRISFVSQHMIKTLEKYGVVKNRITSHIQMFDSIPVNLKNAWLVGYIDGNGTIGNGEISICTNKVTAESIEKYSKKNYSNFKCNIVDYNNYVVMHIFCLELFCIYLYATPFRLSRKKEKAEFALYTHFGGKINIYKKTNHCIDCGKPILPTSLRCKKCSEKYANKNSKKPNKESLIEDLQCANFCEIARKYNVSDNAVRKWCKSYNLPYTTKDLKQWLKE